MPPTPRRIQTADLPSAMRGYDRTATDRLLKEVAAGYEEIWLERKELREQVERLESELAQLREQERLVGEALMAAERTADEVRAAAQREADAIVEEARTERERLESGISRLRDLIEQARSNLSPLLTDMLQRLDAEEVAPGERVLLEDLEPTRPNSEV